LSSYTNYKGGELKREQTLLQPEVAVGAVENPRRKRHCIINTKEKTRSGWELARPAN